MDRGAATVALGRFSFGRSPPSASRRSRSAPCSRRRSSAAAARLDPCRRDGDRSGRHARPLALPGARRHMARLSALSRCRRRTRSSRDPRSRLVRLLRRDERVAQALAQAGVRRSRSTRAATAPRERAATSAMSASSTTISPTRRALREALSESAADADRPFVRRRLCARVAGAPLGASVRSLRAAGALSRRSRADQPPAEGRGYGLPDLPRIVALTVLSRLESMGAVAARHRLRQSAGGGAIVTSHYSSLLANYGRRDDWQAGSAPRPAGSLDCRRDDELMDAPGYQRVAPLGVRVTCCRASTTWESSTSRGARAIVAPPRNPQRRA